MFYRLLMATLLLFSAIIISCGEDKHYVDLTKKDDSQEKKNDSNKNNSNDNDTNKSSGGAESVGEILKFDISYKLPWIGPAKKFTEIVGKNRALNYYINLKLSSNTLGGSYSIYDCTDSTCSQKYLKYEIKCDEHHNCEFTNSRQGIIWSFTQITPKMNIHMYIADPDLFEDGFHDEHLSVEFLHSLGEKTNLKMFHFVTEPKQEKKAKFEVVGVALTLTSKSECIVYSSSLNLMNQAKEKQAEIRFKQKKLNSTSEKYKKLQNQIGSLQIIIDNYVTIVELSKNSYIATAQIIIKNSPIVIPVKRLDDFSGRIIFENNGILINNETEGNTVTLYPGVSIKAKLYGAKGCGRQINEDDSLRTSITTGLNDLLLTKK